MKSGTGKTWKILAVDDDRKNLRLLEGLLVPEGYTVITAESGEEGLDKIENQDPDLILLDIMMPTVDGFEVLKQLKDRGADFTIPVIMITALNEQESRIRALDMGADDFLLKPIDRAELLVRVRSLLKMKDYHDRMQDHRMALEKEVSHQTEKLARYNQRLELLSWTTQQINRTLEIPVVVRTIISSSMDLLSASGAAVCLSKDESAFFGEFCLDGKFVGMDSEQAQCPLMATIVQSGNPIIFYEGGDRSHLPKFAAEKGVEHLVMVPLGNPRTRVRGVLLAFDRDRAERFDEADQDLLQGLASSASIALENAEMMEEIRRSEKVMFDSLREKDILLKEIHHRVKNNLQAISGLFDVHQYGEGSGAHVDAFRKGRNLARTMALIHEQLYRSTDVSRVDFRVYLQKLTDELIRTFPDVEERVSLELDIEDLHLNIDTAVPVGLVVTELVSNALKYAFTDGRSGHVRLSMKQDGNGGYRMSVTDNGAGFPEGFDPRSSSSLGLDIVRSIIASLKGEFRMENGSGVKIFMAFPEYWECRREEL